MSLTLIPDHPRRFTKVAPELTPDQRERQLRRSSTPTTAHCWRRTGLPDPHLASIGVPASEIVVSLVLVAFCWAPVVAISQAGWALASAVVSLVVALVVIRVRRVVVGTDYLAVRQLGRFHVATTDHVRHLELRPSSRGGVLCVHTDDGRCMRLRRVEVARPDVNAALRQLSGTHTRDSHVEELLSLEHDDTRLRHRYLADAVQ